MPPKIEDQYPKEFLDILKGIYLIYGTDYWHFEMPEVENSGLIEVFANNYSNIEFSEYISRLANLVFSDVKFMDVLGYKFTPEFIEWIGNDSI